MKKELLKKTFDLCSRWCNWLSASPKEGKLVTEVVEKRVEVPVEVVKEVVREVIVQRIVRVKASCPKEQQIVSSQSSKPKYKKNRIIVGHGVSYSGLEVEETSSKTVVKEKHDFDYMFQYQRSLDENLNVGLAITANRAVFGTIGVDF